MHILVTPPGEIDQQDFVFRQGRRELGSIGDGMARFERRDNPLQTAKIVESLQSFGIGDGDVFGAPRILEPGVFRADAGIIEAGRNRVRLDDLAIFCLLYTSPSPRDRTRSRMPSSA